MLGIKIYYSRVSDAGVRFVIESAPGSQLRELNLTNCSKLSDVTILRMSQRWALWLLIILSLNCFDCHFQLAIFYFCLLSFPSSCKSLSYLCLCYCEHISDTGVELLGHIPTLTSIDLSGCDIHDHGVAGLRKNANIRDLSLAEVEDLTDDGLQVSEKLSQLYNLKIKLFVWKIIHHCPQICSLA